MSEYYRGGGEPVGVQAPGTVTVVAIIGMMLGLLGGMWAGWSVYDISTPSLINGVVSRAVREDSFLWTHEVVFDLVGVVLSLAEMIAAIGAFTLRAWSWRLFMVFAIAKLLNELIALVIYLVWIQPIVRRDVTYLLGGSSVEIVSALLMANRLIFGIGWPMIVLALLTRREVRAAFGLGGKVPYAAQYLG